MNADYRKINDGTQNSSKYHKKDSTATRAILKREAEKEIQESELESFSGIITEREDIAKFILAPKTETGSAVFTLSMAAKRFTYKVGYKESGWNGKPIYFVKVLTGADNTNSYTYLGYLQDEGAKYKHGKRIGYEAPSAKMFRALVRRVFVRTLDLPDTVEFRHEGRCGRCGRPLTVPESVDTGFGPDCAAKLGLEWAKHESVISKKRAKEISEIVGDPVLQFCHDEEEPNTQKSSIDFGKGDTPLEECNDCGAHALDGKPIAHHFNCESPCISGESKEWEEHYSKEDELLQDCIQKVDKIMRPKKKSAVTDGMNNKQFADFLTNME